MPHNFPAISDEPWLRQWLLLDDWQNDPAWETGFVGIAGSSPSSLAAMNAMLGNTKGPNPRSLEEIFRDTSACRALVLLGRPEAGKSHELRRFQRDLPNSVFIQAKEVGEPLPRHLDRVTEGKEKPITLVFDSLDESLIENANTVGSLFLWLRSRDKRLGDSATRLVLSCRWADWPESQLKSSVQEWTDQLPATYVLLPLGAEDVLETAKWVLREKGDSFWKELHERNLMWLACWPRAFITMMRTWHQQGNLPESPRDLINQFVSQSLQVTNDQDEILRQSRNPNDSHWMERVAGRVAAGLFFSGKSSFSLAGTAAPESLSFLELLGDEQWNLILRSVVDEDLRKLKSGTSLLRILPTPARLVFHSQVVQETLAAKWLAAQKLSLSRLTRLFCHVGDCVFPQLHALAAALAEQQADFRQWLLEHDPAVLLLADHTGLDNGAKHTIVNALLDYTQRIQVVDTSVWQGHLGTLSYPGLLDQLRPRLSHQATPPAVVQVAIEIAAKAKPDGTAEMLWEHLSLWMGRLKSHLARAIINTAPGSIPPEWQNRWRSVIDKNVPTDEEGILIGHALACMVPKHLPLRDAVEWLVPEGRFSVMGTFSFFLWNAGSHVTPEDVPTVLKYMTRERVFYLDHTEGEGPFSQEMGLAIHVLRAGFLHLDAPEIRKALEEYWVELMTHTNFGCQFVLPDLAFWIEKFSLTENNRRDFAIGFLSKHRCTFPESMFDEFECFLLDGKSDGPWLLELIPQAQGTLASNLPQVVRRLFRRHDFRQEHPRLLLEAWKVSPYLQQIFPANPGEDGPLPQLDRLDAAEATARAEQNEQRNAKIAAQTHRQKTEWKEQLASMEAKLNQSHRESALVWPEIYGFLLLSRCGRDGNISHKYALPPVSPEAWISEAARRFLLEFPAQSVTYDSGIMAQLALTRLGVDSLNDQSILRRLEDVWLPWLIHGVYPDHPAWMPRGLEWLQRFPASELMAFSKIIHSRYHGKDGMTFLKNWSERWTETHTATLVKLLLENPIQQEGAGQAWFFLAEQDFPAARHVVESWHYQLMPPVIATINEGEKPVGIGPTPSEGLREMSRSVGTAQELVWGIEFACCRGLFWETLKETAHSEDEFVKRSIQSVHHSWSRWQFYAKSKELADWVQSTEWTSDSALVAFAEIIWRNFPGAKPEPTSYMGARALTWQDDIVAMRHSVVNEAQRRGLMVNPPAGDEAQVPRLLYEANHHRLAREWHPFSASDFFRYARQPEARLARDNDQFRDCVLEALDQWEIEVQSPAGQCHLRDLATGKYLVEPVISKGLKDWLKRHLKIIGSAESQPFQTTGERLDVLLEWPIPQWHRILSLIIEVKKDTYQSGSKTVRTEMGPQLLRGYLEPQHHSDNSITHGLYLVIWLTGLKSDAVTTKEISNLREDLLTQAQNLSVSPFTLASRVIDARAI